ncbi:MAG: adenine deaminase [Bacteroidia bacterium]|nr:adenine deaminase [Bacteroidia bacterium]
MMGTFQICGWFADFDSQDFYFGELTIARGKVAEIRETGGKRLTWGNRDLVSPVILPGLIDSHVHIESSMLMPSRFAAQAIRYGTVGTVSDPHEIANVLGLEGIELMMKDAEKACLKIHFTAPSCVPATSMESNGAFLDAGNLYKLFSENKVVAMGEMMNFPGVLAGDTDVMGKIGLAKSFGKPVDGHAPGLSGALLDRYIQAGIHTDHECFSMAEAEEKISKGMKVLIREGSSARNFDQLFQVIDKYPGMVMLCTDDYHPDDLMDGHIDRLIRRGVAHGVNFFNLYRAAGINPVEHYKLHTGMLRPGDPADFIVVDRLDPFRVTATYINGVPVFQDDRVGVEMPPIALLNLFNAAQVNSADLEIKGQAGFYRIIHAWDGELITGSETAHLIAKDGIVEGDLKHDILKIVVLNRYRPAKPSVGWITGFGIKKGAIASSIAHDSHNIIAVGTSDEEIAEAINQIIFYKGGIVVTESGISHILPLPIAGLMSQDSAAEVGFRYAELTGIVRGFGSSLKAPFMALSFMALLVIPHLKIGDKGLFNCDTFEFTDLKAD